MRWVITEDHLGDTLPTNVGKGNFPVHRASELPFEFRLLDDDKVIYYIGRCDNPADAEEEDAFDPLDWAMHDSGCTTFLYRANQLSNWETL